MTFGHLTHTLSPNTVWDVRVGRFVYSQDEPPSSGDRDDPEPVRSRDGRHERRAAAVRRADDSSARPPRRRISHYRPGLLGADHEWKIGGQVERGEHHALHDHSDRRADSSTTTGSRLSRSRALRPTPAGMFITASAFASDAITIGRSADDQCRRCGSTTAAPSARICPRSMPHGRRNRRRSSSGLGTLYTWNVVSPRLGVTAKLTRRRPDDAARRATGRFSQGVLTGEIGPFHPGATPITTTAFDPATGGYTQLVSVVDPKINLQLDPDMRAPRTDEYSVGVDREIGRRLAVGDRVRAQGGRELHRMDRRRRPVSRRRRGRCPTAARVPVFVLDQRHSAAARRFLLTNPDGYSLTYNGLVMVVEKRRSHGWQAFGSYTLLEGDRAAGLERRRPPPAPQVSTDRSAARQSSRSGGIPTISPTRAAGCRTIARTCSGSMGSVDVPRTGFVVAANLQYFSGKPWAATTHGAAAAEATSAFCSSRAARAGCRRRRCSICACRGRSRSAASGASSCCSTCSTRSTTRRKKAWRPTTCSARISGSPRCSSIRAARCSA